MKRFIALFVLAFLAAGCSNEGGDQRELFQPEIKEGRPAPDFLFTDINDKPFRLSEQRGKVVVLFFWRLKCRECVESMPSLEALYRRLKDRGLEVVAVDADSIHSAELYDVMEFLKEHELTFRVLYDEDGFVSEAFMVIRVPAAFIIDKDGTIARIVEGKADWSSGPVATTIESLLGEGA